MTFLKTWVIETEKKQETISKDLQTQKEFLTLNWYVKRTEIAANSKKVLKNEWNIVF